MSHGVVEGGCGGMKGREEVEGRKERIRFLNEQTTFGCFHAVFSLTDRKEIWRKRKKVLP